MNATATPSTNIQAKAAEYLLGQRVRVARIDGRTGFAATVRGSSPRPYTVTYQAEVWRCDCPATRTCAHIVACQAIWTPQP
jgi:hypothetical protein